MVQIYGGLIIPYCSPCVASKRPIQECQLTEGNMGFMLRPDPPEPPGSACFTLPKYLIWRNNLAKNVLWHIVELSQTIATCLRALVMATLIRLLSPKNPTAPMLFERT